MSLDSLLQKFSERAGFGSRKRVGGGPPRLIEPMRVPYGPFRFKAQVHKGAHYEILASTDFENWKTIVTATAETTPVEYVDSEAFKFGYRFYRLWAGEEPSVNVIGYASMTLPPGFSMIANPFDTVETVAEQFKGWADGTSLNKFDTRLFRLGENTRRSGQWANSAEKLLPGEGAILFNPTRDYKLLTFAGEVGQGHLSVPVPAGFSVRSSLLPRPGNLEELGFPIVNGDVIHLFDRDRQAYVLHPYANGTWPEGPPMVGVGESFWVAKTEPGNWEQRLEIWR